MRTRIQTMLARLRRTPRGQLLGTAGSASSPEALPPSAKAAQQFVNRLTELGLLREVGNAGRNGLTVVTGSPGIGKTALIIEAARDVESVVIDLDFCPSTSDAIQTIGESLRIAGWPTRELDSRMAQLDQVRRTLTEHLGPTFTHVFTSSIGTMRPEIQETYSSLVREAVGHVGLYDMVTNPEKALAESLVSDIALAGSPRRDLVVYIDGLDRARVDRSMLAPVLDAVASRSHLAIAIRARASLPPCLTPLGTLLELPPLELPAVIDMARLGCRAGGLEVNDTEVRAIAQFSRGLPLAIRWAVDRMVGERSPVFLPVAENVLDSLANNLLDITDPELRRLAEKCSIPRHITAELLESLDPGLPGAHAYARLHDLSLFTQTRHGLALQPEVREFASRAVQQRDPMLWSSVNAACREYYLKAVETIPRTGPTQIAWESACLELCHHTMQRDRAEGFRLLSNSLIQTFERSDLEFATALIADNDHIDFEDWERASLEYFKGELQFRRGEWEAARQSLRDAVSRENAGHPMYSAACMTLGRLLYQSGDLEMAEEWLSVCLRQPASSPGSRAYAEEQLAKVLRMRGELTAAVSAHERAVANASEAGATYAHASSLGSWGTSLILAGRLAAGIDKLHESVAMSRSHGYRHFVCTGSRSRAAGLLLAGRLTEARTDATRALELATDVGDIYNQAFAGFVLANVDSILEHRVHSDLWVAAIGALRGMGARADEANARLRLADSILDTSGELGAAAEQVASARTVLSGMTFDYGTCDLLLTEARLAEESANWARSHAVSVHAVQLAARIGADYLAARGRLGVVRAEVRSGSRSSMTAEFLDELTGDATAMASSAYFETAASMEIVRFELLLRREAHGRATDAGKRALTNAALWNGVRLERCLLDLVEVAREGGAEAIAHEIVAAWRAETHGRRTGAEWEASLLAELEGARTDSGAGSG